MTVETPQQYFRRVQTRFNRRAANDRAKTLLGKRYPAELAELREAEFVRLQKQHKLL